MSEKNFVPALQHPALTPLYDWVLIFSGLGPSFKRRLAPLADIQNKPGEIILDIGSGTGTHARILAAAYPLMTVVGIEPDPTLITFSEKFPTQSNLTYYKADASCLPYADQSVAYVFSTLVFHHLTPDEKAVALAEIYRVLKPDGTFILVDWGQLRVNAYRHFLYLVEQKNCIDSHFDGTFLEQIKENKFRLEKQIRVKRSGMWLYTFKK